MYEKVLQMSISDSKHIPDHADNSIVRQELILYVQVKVITFGQSEQSLPKQAKGDKSLAIFKICRDLLLR